MVVSEGNVFYAYIHYKPDFTPFYVGKGLLRRANSLKQRNPYYMATVEKYGMGNILIGKFECTSEANAFELEIGIIKCLKKAGVKLTNFTDGGEGASGRVQSEETRAKISAAQIGKTFSAETRAKISASQTGKTHSEAAKIKISASRMGKTHSAETRAKIGALGKGRVFTAEHRTNLSAAKMGNTACLGKTHSAETRAKISAAHKLRRINGST